MKILKITAIAILFISAVAFTNAAHKYYVSTTTVEYVADTDTVQIISEYFTDDIEKVLRQRYRPNVHLDSKKETEEDQKLLQEYVMKQMNLKINGTPVEMKYLGFKYSTDAVKCFIEICGIVEINSIEIENKALMELFEKQENIFHINTGTSRKSISLTKTNPSGVLKF